LIAERFLTTDREGETPVATLAHEALLRSWDRIVSWININRENLRLRARVEQQQQRWEQQDRDESLLLAEGLPLDDGRKLVDEATYLLTASTKGYIDASIAHQESSARKSRRVRTVVLSTIGALVVAMAVGGFIAWQINEQNQQQAALEQRATAASGLVQRLLDVEALGLKVAIDDLIPYRDLARAELTKAYEDSDDTSKAKLHAALALVGEDESALSFLKERLLQVTPAQFGPVREQLDTYKEQLTKDYWDIALNNEGEPSRRFHAACAIAKYDTENDDWADPELVRFIANQLVGVLPSELVPWRDA
ncbi:MAG: hypothetical protein GY904_33085, partial [Planctomycetaceae bacterium]|nr:hypothetical protein [Planctomycetaceae bacterium]